MKKLFSVSILMLALAGAKAQQGSILVGGDIAFDHSKSPAVGGDVKNNSIEFNPTIGYQFHPNFTAGIVAGIGQNKSENPLYTTKTTNFNAGPFLRYSTELSNIFSIYGQLEGRFGSSKAKQNSNTLNEQRTAEVNLFPAVFINLKNNFGLNLNIGGISYSSIKPKGGDASTNFGINFGRVGAIGVSKNF